MIFERRYLFQGHAVGAAVRIRRYRDNAVEMPVCFEGSAALPVTGGCVESKSGRRDLQHEQHGFVLSFDSAYGKATGDFADQRAAIAHTYAVRGEHRIPTRIATEARVEGLDVQHRLLVERLECELVSEDPRNHGEVRFSAPKMPQIIGVKVDGHPLTVEIDDVFLNAATKRALADEFEDSERFRETYKDRFYHTGKDDTVLGTRRIPEIAGYFVTSIVRRLSFGNGMPLGATIEGNRLTLPNFGKIFFGELLIGDKDRRLTMLRLQLGSDWGGDGGLCESKPNGHDAP